MWLFFVVCDGTYIWSWVLVETNGRAFVQGCKIWDCKSFHFPIVTVAEVGTRHAYRELVVLCAFFYWLLVYSIHFQSQFLRVNFCPFKMIYNFKLGLFCAYIQLLRITHKPWQLPGTNFLYKLLRNLWHLLIPKAFEHILALNIKLSSLVLIPHRKNQPFLSLFLFKPISKDVHFLISWFFVIFF